MSGMSPTGKLGNGWGQCAEMGTPDRLVETAISQFGTRALAKHLRVTELELISWAAGTKPMPQRKRGKLIELVRKTPVLSGTFGATVDSDKEAKQRVSEIDEMRRETEAIIAESAKLIAEMRLKLEDMRQLQAAHEALLEQRKQKKKP